MEVSAVSFCLPSNATVDISEMYFKVVYHQKSIQVVTRFYCSKLFNETHTFLWHLEISYLPGKTNHEADVMSRYSSPNGELVMRMRWRQY